MAEFRVLVEQNHPVTTTLLRQTKIKSYLQPTNLNTFERLKEKTSKDIKICCKCPMSYSFSLNLTVSNFTVVVFFRWAVFMFHFNFSVCYRTVSLSSYKQVSLFLRQQYVILLKGHQIPNQRFSSYKSHIYGLKWKNCLELFVSSRHIAQTLELWYYPHQQIYY